MCVCVCVCVCVKIRCTNLLSLAYPNSAKIIQREK